MADQFQYVKLPDGSYGKFRADATDDQIRGVIQNDFPDAFKPSQQAQSTISARPSGIGQYLKDLEGDVRYGTTSTLPGKVLHALGAQGVNVGAQAKASGVLASPILGPIHAAQGVAQIPSKPLSGAGKAVSGLLETATIPAAFVAPEGLNQAPEAALAVGEYANKVPLIGKLFASTTRAGRNFQAVNNAAGNAAVQITPQLSDAAIAVKEMGDAGGRMPTVVSKFINRVTRPGAPPLDFDEARLFAQNASKLSVADYLRATPAMRRLIGQFHGALNDAIQGTADSAGVGDQFAQAMTEYHQAMQNRRAVQTLLGGTALYKGRKAVQRVGETLLGQ